MGYVVNGTELEIDDDGFLVEPDFSDEVVPVIAEAENITLTDDHWTVINYMRNKYKEDGQTPNFRNMCKDFDEEHPGTDWKNACMNCSRCSPTASPRRWPACRSRLAKAVIRSSKSPGSGFGLNCGIRNQEPSNEILHSRQCSATGGTSA